MKLKTLLFSTAALAALGLGLWLSLSTTQTTMHPAVANLFASKVVFVGGQTYPLTQHQGKPLLINVWAPWCAPCVEELPELSALAASPAAKGVQFIGLGVDTATHISDFSVKYPVSFPLVVAGTAGTAFAKAVDNKAGALPFTALVDAQGQIVGQKTGKVSAAEVTAWIAKLK